MSIVEIIIAVSLVSIVLVFMINLLITVKSSSDAAQNKSTALINRAIITREIVYDLKNYNISGIEECEDDVLTAFIVNMLIPPGALTNYCVKLVYDELLVDRDSSRSSLLRSGFLIQYQYLGKSYVGYVRGANRVVRESPYIMNSKTDPATITATCMASDNTFCAIDTVNGRKCSKNERICSITINMPIKDAESNDYSIKFSFLVDRFRNIETMPTRTGFYIWTHTPNYKYSFILSKDP